jgi:hypothetical protein
MRTRARGEATGLLVKLTRLVSDSRRRRPRFLFTFEFGGLLSCIARNQHGKGLLARVALGMELHFYSKNEYPGP